jgi:hypothetical protein
MDARIGQFLNSLRGTGDAGRLAFSVIVNRLLADDFDLVMPANKSIFTADQARKEALGILSEADIADAVLIGGYRDIGLSPIQALVTATEKQNKAAGSRGEMLSKIQGMKADVQGSWEGLVDSGLETLKDRWFSRFMARVIGPVTPGPVEDFPSVAELEIPPEMRQDYSILMEAQFLIHGDSAAAAKGALALLQRKWGMSAFGNRWRPFPPELVHRDSIGLVLDNFKRRWKESQQFLRSQGEEVNLEPDLKNMLLIPVPLTEGTGWTVWEETKIGFQPRASGARRPPQRAKARRGWNRNRFGCLTPQTQTTLSTSSESGRRSRTRRITPRAREIPSSTPSGTSRVIDDPVGTHHRARLGGTRSAPPDPGADSGRRPVPIPLRPHRPGDVQGCLPAREYRRVVHHLARPAGQAGA